MPESAAKRKQVKNKVESLTAAVEQIVREWRKSDLAAQVTSYYDSMSDEQVKEDEAWGKFSEHEM